MNTSNEQWIVEDFRLGSPVKEFEDYCQGEIERLRTSDPDFDDSKHRAARDLVLRKLGKEPKEIGGGP